MKLKYVDNNLIYDKKRLQLDFCGINNSRNDTFRTKFNLIKKKTVLNY